MIVVQAHRYQFKLLYICSMLLSPAGVWLAVEALCSRQQGRLRQLMHGAALVATAAIGARAQHTRR